MSGKTRVVCPVTFETARPGGSEWTALPCKNAPFLTPFDSPEAAIARERYWVFPSGLALRDSDLPWVWCVAIEGLTKGPDYLYGTASEADRYARWYEKRGKTVTAFSVPREHLNGMLVSGLYDDDQPVLARPFPAWTRDSGQAPRHEQWPGIAPGRKVWPVVPSGFTSDFAFKY